MSLFCPQITHSMWLSHFLSLRGSVRAPQDFFCVMTLTVLRSAGHVFCRLSLILGLSDVSPRLARGSRFSRRRPGRCPSDHIMSGVHAVTGLVPHVRLRHLAEAVFTAGSSTEPLPPLSTLLGSESRSAAYAAWGQGAATGNTWHSSVGKRVSSPGFMYSLNHLYQFGFMDIYFIIWV